MRLKPDPTEGSTGLLSLLRAHSASDPKEYIEALESALLLEESRNHALKGENEHLESAALESAAKAAQLQNAVEAAEAETLLADLAALAPGGE